MAGLGLFCCKIPPDAIWSHNGSVCARRVAGSWKYLAGCMRAMKQDFQLELLSYLDFFLKKETNASFQEKWNQTLTCQESRVVGGKEQ